MPNALISFLKLFRDIPANDEALIITATENRSHKEGDYLFRADNICREMYFICNGVLRIMMLNEQGNEITYFFLKENQFCTILNSFNNNVVAHESISAACDVEVLVFSRQALIKLYEQLPYLKTLIDQITQQALLDKIDLKNSYLGQDSTTRYKNFMMRQPDIALRVPLSDVASYLGITPQSLSRIRKNIRQIAFYHLLSVARFGLPKFAVSNANQMEQLKKQLLTGKKVVVLGGSSGIGLATAKAMAIEGANVIIISSNQQRIDNALAELPEHSKGFAIDLTNEQQVKDFFMKLGRFDHLVYTAGESLQLVTVADAIVAEAQQFFNLRYWGAFMAVKYASPNINAGGSITLTGGIAGQRPLSGWSLGASICAAMEGFTRAMAIELAPVRVNLVSPGVVKTNLWNSMTEAERESLYTGVGNNLPIKRVGEAEDIAQTYLYLVNQQYSTGQVVVVDGGSVLV